MIRTVWFAVVCLSGAAAAAAAIKAGQAPEPAVVVAAPETLMTSIAVKAEPASPGASPVQNAALTPLDRQAHAPNTPAQDTLTEADRVDVSHLPILDDAATRAVPDDPPALTQPGANVGKAVTSPANGQRPQRITATAALAPAHDESQAAKMAARGDVRTDIRNDVKHDAKSTTKHDTKSSKPAAHTARAKARTDTRPCRQPEGFAGFLKIFNLGPRCAT